jgi:hypothetical protein
MKKVCVAMLVLVAGVTAALAVGAKEKYVIVKTTDFARENSYEVMTPDEFKTLTADINAEGKLFQKALKAAEKEWKSNEDTAKKTFPSSAISPRKAATVGQPYTEREKAEDKMADIQEEEENKKLKEEEKRSKTYGKGKGKEKDDEKDFAIEQAREMFQTKMDELTKEDGGGGAKKGEEKEGEKEEAKKAE